MSCKEEIWLNLRRFYQYITILTSGTAQWVGLCMFRCNVNTVTGHGRPSLVGAAFLSGCYLRRSWSWLGVGRRQIASDPNTALALGQRARRAPQQQLKSIKHTHVCLPSSQRNSQVQGRQLYIHMYSEREHYWPHFNSSLSRKQSLKLLWAIIEVNNCKQFRMWQTWSCSRNWH